MAVQIGFPSRVTTARLRRRMSLRSRAILALTLTAGFYIFAIAIALALLALPYVMVVAAHRLYLYFAFVAVASAIAILYAILPRPQRFVPPGPRLDLARQPRLAGELRSIAEAVGEPMPTEVYLEMAVNAGVLEAGGLLGLGAHRVMVIGLPLMRALTLSQFRAVIVHEFGHYQAGDTRLDPWIYRTRLAILDTIRRVGRRSWLLRWPFVGYGIVFLRLTQAIARQQELAADALAAEAVGKAVAAQALTAVSAGWFVFGEFWKQEMWPAVNGGFRPPMLEGFARFSGVPRIQKAVSLKLRTEMAGTSRDPYDSHPPLAERLAALERAAEHPAPAYDPPAHTLLEELPQLEVDLLAHFVGPGVIRAEPAGWDDLAVRQYLPGYRANVLRYGDLFGGATLVQVPELLAHGAEIGQAIRRRAGSPPLPPDKAAEPAKGTIGAAITVALVDAGWQYRMPMEGDATLARGASSLAPFSAVHRLMVGQLRPEEWRSWCIENGVAGIRLAAPARAAAAAAAP